MQLQKRRGNKFFYLLKQAVMGGEQEFTSGSIDRAIFLLSVPMILEMVMESLFSVVDIYFVSRISDEATATVGLTESMLTIVYSLGMGLAMGVTALVARRIGEKDPAAASNTALQAIYLGIAISVVVSITGILFAPDLLRLMGGSEKLISEGSGYTRIILGGNFVIVLLFLNNGIFRGAGDASIAMRALWLSNLMNIALVPCLINGYGPFPALGLEGAAIATTIGRGCGVLYQFYHLYRGNRIISLTHVSRKLNRDTIGKIVEVAAGGAGQFLITSASWVILVMIIAEFGSAALAGYTIGIRVIIFAILPAWGMANAAATLVGQNLGAGKPERAEQSVWRTAFFNMLFLGTISILFWFLAEPIIMLFNKKAEVVSYGIECLRYVCIGYVFYAYGMVILQSFNGAGDTRTPLVMNIFGFWMFQIPLAYTLAVWSGLGPKGVFLAISIAESALAVAGIILFRQGKWKLIKV